MKVQKVAEATRIICGDISLKAISVNAVNHFAKKIGRLIADAAVYLDQPAG